MFWYYSRCFICLIVVSLIAWTENSVSAQTVDTRPVTELQKQGNSVPNKRLVQVQLLGINDFHGQLNVTRNVNGKPVGRADYLAAHIKQRAAANHNTLLVHSGDMVGASPPISALFQDKPTIEILNAIGFDIGTVGNHEFDKGTAELFRLIYGAAHQKTKTITRSSLPWIAANVLDKKTGEPILPPYKVVTVEEIPIGFIGVVTKDTPNLVNPSSIRNLEFIDEVDAINRNVAILKKQGVRSIIVLAHAPGTSGPNGENPSGKLVDIANRVDDEVDVIFGGHNHAYMNSIINKKLVVQAHSYGTALADVDIVIDPKTKDIIDKRAEIITTYHEGTKPDPQIRKMIKRYEAKAGPIINRVIGTASIAINAKPNKHGESVLGDFISDAQRKIMKSDIAITNPGGIRADINKGNITWGDIYTVQPFNNELVRMTMTGKQIRDLLNKQWGEKTQMLQISGFSYTWDLNKPIGKRIVSIKLSDGRELEPNKTYTVTANSFLSNGGDGFISLAQTKKTQKGPAEIDALVQSISSMPKPFTYSIQNRIQRLD